MIHGQTGEESLDFGDVHLYELTFVVEQDVAFDPSDVTFLDVNGVVLSA